jgi:ornithine decarboxylase
LGIFRCWQIRGLIETIDESLKYPIFLERENKNLEKKEVILAGPTCDSADILYENFKYFFSN